MEKQDITVERGLPASLRLEEGPSDRAFQKHLPPRPDTHPRSLGVLLWVLAEVMTSHTCRHSAQGWHLVTLPLSVSREPCGTRLWT